MSIIFSSVADLGWEGDAETEKTEMPVSSAFDVLLGSRFNNFIEKGI